MKTFFDWMASNRYYTEDTRTGMPVNPNQQKAPVAPNQQQTTGFPDNRDTSVRRAAPSNPQANNQMNVSKEFENRWSANFPLIVQSLKQAGVSIKSLSPNDQSAATRGISNISKNLDNVAKNFIDYKNQTVQTFAILRNMLNQKRQELKNSPPPVDRMSDPAYSREAGKVR
jgi:hypothetical protein